MFLLSEDYSNASKFFKKVAEKEKPISSVKFLFFFQKLILRKKDLKTRQATWAGSGKRGTPTPIYHTFLDQWELLRKKRN